MPSRRTRLTRFLRTLRFRLAATFLLMVTAVLAIVGWVSTTALRTVLENQSESQLNVQLGALKGWFTFDEGTGHPLWDEVDWSDPEEVAELGLLQKVYVMADDHGHLYKATTDPALSALWDRKMILAELEQIQQTHKPILKTIRGARQSSLSSFEQYDVRCQASAALVRGRRP